MDNVSADQTQAKTPQRGKRRWRLPILLTCVALLCYSALIEPRWIVVERIEVRLPRLPQELDGFTIVQMSDFHSGRYTEAGRIHHAVRIANGLHPDLFALTGDYVTRSSGNAEPCARILRELRAPFGTVAVLGNHDVWTSGDHVAYALSAQGITVLRNAAVPVTRAGKRLWIAGLDDAWSGNPKLFEALRDVPSGDAVVLLAHEPDFADSATAYPIDLQLSGHTHGGQVRLPFLGAPVVPQMGRKYRYGLHHAGALPVYVTRGVGTVGPPPLRFNCRPEITLITLRAAAK